MTPYVYWIEDTWTGLHYIGKRVAEGCHPDDLLTTYFTSSNYVKPLAKANPERFVILYTQIVDSKEKAGEVEEGLQRWTNCHRRPDAYYNKNIAGKEFGNHSLETRTKISRSKKGQKPSPQCIAAAVKSLKERGAWNKGKTDLPPSWNKGKKFPELSETASLHFKRCWEDPSIREKMLVNVRNPSDATRKKMSEAKKGRPSCRKGMKSPCSVDRAMTNTNLSVEDIREIERLTKADFISRGALKALCVEYNCIQSTVTRIKKGEFLCQK
jgi:hypothetical protein